MPTLTLKNPHSVLAALDVRPRDVLEVRLRQRAPHDAWQQVVDAAKSAGVPVRIVPEGSGSPSRRSPDKDGRTSPAEALLQERLPTDLADLFAGDPSDHGLWLALDQLQDPHNVGAVFRTAAFFGVRGIVLTKHKSAPLSSTAYDVASGGVEHVPFALATNLRQALDVAKERGLWVLGTSEHAARSVWDVARDRRWLLVMGNEEAGLRKLTAETCDELCRIPAAGAIGSLNVSVAAGAMLAALTRPSA